MNRSLVVLRAGRVLEQLTRIAAQRASLDAARAEALELIFDQEVYFYPYNPPEPPRTPGDYARAQRRVDELVAAVRRIWKKPAAVPLSGELRAALEELRWGTHRLAALDLPAELPPDVPPWAIALPVDLTEVTLHEFAWDEHGARELAEGRLVRARNERSWGDIAGGVPGLGPDAVPDNAEREQVRITNEYRAMLGRRSLAWNPRLQVAAQQHSDYMANTGDFGHTEEDPARHTMQQRYEQAGYRGTGGENVARNGGGAQTAHDGWVQSSGHHRNLLSPRHREMGSGLAGFYWTQNFGSDDRFMKELGQ
jgi:hypothetical protein